MQGASRRGVPEWLIASCGVWHIGLGLYFIFLRPALLPEDVRYMGADLHALQAEVPRLTEWLEKVFIVMGGFMAAAGLMTAAVALAADLHRPAVAAAVALAGVAGVMLMSAVNFSLSSDYKWLLLVPALLWAAAAALAAAGIRRP